jgi:site-specific DNA recombinase
VVSLTGISTKVEKAINFISNLGKTYAESDLTVKSKLLSSIFPEKLVFDGKKCRTTRINELLWQTLLIDKGFKKIKSGQTFPKLDLSAWVVSTGIEPVSNV